MRRSSRILQMAVEANNAPATISQKRDVDRLCLLNLPAYETTKGYLDYDKAGHSQALPDIATLSPEEPFQDSGSEYVPSNASVSRISASTDNDEDPFDALTRNLLPDENNLAMNVTRELNEQPNLNEELAVPKEDITRGDRIREWLDVNDNNDVLKQADLSFQINKSLENTEKIKMNRKNRKTYEKKENKENKKSTAAKSKKISNDYNETIVLKTAKRDDVTNKRVRNKCHSCYFCDLKIRNCARHFELIHGDELEIAKILAMPKNSKDRKVSFGEIIKAGDFLHNCNVLAMKMGELILIRRPTVLEAKNLTYASYGPCPECLGFMVKKQIWRHLKYSCPKNKNNIFKQLEVARRPIEESTALLNGIFGCEITKPFKTDILDKLRSDEVSLVCKGDSLIQRFGFFLYEKYGESQCELIRQSMRQLARFLIEIRKLDIHIESLHESLHPKHFDKVVEATKKLCASKSERVMRPVFDIPSLALKIGYSLKKCINVERGKAIRIGDTKSNESLLSFQHLLEMEWSTRISSNALSTLHRRKFNCTELLPLTSDVAQLTKYLESEIKFACQELKKSFSVGTYFRLSRITLSKILLFNKRRSGEAAKMTIAHYSSRPDHANADLFADALSTFEKKLASHLTLVEIEGKRGRKVPVLLTPDLKAAIDILNNHRHEANILPENPFIFAPAKSQVGHLRGHDCLKTACQEANLKSPETITGTKLRKYVSTVAQIFNMTENEYDWLARHLGHDIRVHRDFYRLHQNTIELTKVSRLLLAVDSGEASKYAGKTLNEINVQEIDGIEEEDDIEGEDEEGTEVSVPNDCDIAIAEKETNEEERPKCPIAYKGNKKKGRKMSTRRPWKEDEVSAVLNHFKVHIKKHIIPGKKDCEECQEKYNILSSRNWTDIKFYVKNHLAKMKKVQGKK